MPAYELPTLPPTVHIVALIAMIGWAITLYFYGRLVKTYGDLVDDFGEAVTMLGFMQRYIDEESDPEEFFEWADGKEVQGYTAKYAPNGDENER